MWNLIFITVMQIKIKSLYIMKVCFTVLIYADFLCYGNENGIGLFFIVMKIMSWSSGPKIGLVCFMQNVGWSLLIMEWNVIRFVTNFQIIDLGLCWIGRRNDYSTFININLQTTLGQYYSSLQALLIKQHEIYWQRQTEINKKSTVHPVNKHLFGWIASLHGE